MPQRSSKYTVDDSFTPYKDIAQTATQMGYKMNTATARHVFYRALEKVALGILQDTNPDMENIKENAKAISKSLEFQYMIMDALAEMDVSQKGQ